MKSTTILLVDDHQLLRAAWTEMLRLQLNLKVIGSTGFAREAIALAETQYPAIILLDLNMQPVDGFELLPLLLQASPSSKVIAVYMYDLPAYAQRFIKLGGYGYVTKDSPLSEMLAAIGEVEQ